MINNKYKTFSNKNACSTKKYYFTLYFIRSVIGALHSSRLKPKF